MTCLDCLETLIQNLELSKFILGNHDQGHGTTVIPGETEKAKALKFGKEKVEGDMTEVYNIITCVDKVQGIVVHQVPDC